MKDEAAAYIIIDKVVLLEDNAITNIIPAVTKPDSRLETITV